MKKVEYIDKITEIQLVFYYYTWYTDLINLFNFFVW